MNMARAVEERAISKYLAKAASGYAIAERQAGKKSYDNLYDLTTERVKEIGRGKYIYHFLDEEAKININTAVKDILERLPGFDSSLADAVLEYRQEKESHKFDLTEELLFVDGFTPGVYNKCRDYITVYSDSKINMNTASVDVFYALGFDKQLAETIREYRMGSDGEEGTIDDRYFESTDQIAVKLNEFKGLSEQQVEDLQKAVGLSRVSVATKELSVFIETSILGRPSTKYNVIIVAEKPEAVEVPEGGEQVDVKEQVKIKKWTEY
jgi:hypothetical protein